MTENWVYEEEPLNGGAGGEAYRVIFNGSGIGPAATLAREAIQNSVDAAIDRDKEVQVIFRARLLTGEDCKDFVRNAGLAELKQRKDSLNLPEDNWLLNTDQPLRLLYVEDFATTGLSGTPSAASSKLRKLLMEIGGSGKIEEDDHTGGSYGFGKAVYGGSSKVATVFAYSRTSDSCGNPISVLMGCTYHNSHTHEGEMTTGRGFFGRPVEVQGRGTRFDPFVGDEADELASSLGFQKRDKDTGTSILIVDCDLSVADIQSGVEESWWPRLRADLLDVELVDEEEKSHFPRPQTRSDLKAYVDAYDVVQERAPTIPGQSYRKPFNRKHGKNIGVLGLKVIDSSESDNEEGDSDGGKADTIALIRSPRMVVQYYAKRSIGVPPLAGVFVADDEIDNILRRAEPPEHNQWAANAQRLSGVESEIVQVVHQRSWSELKSFQKSARPAESNRPQRLRRLEQALSKWFGSSSRQVPMPEREESPVSVRPLVGVEPDGDALRLTGVVTLELKPDAEEDRVPVEIRLKCNVQEEESVSSSDPIPLNVTKANNAQACDSGWAGVLDPETSISLEIRSDKYDPTWTVQFVPEVLPRNTSGGTGNVA